LSPWNFWQKKYGIPSLTNCIDKMI
jgi:hypothetical protein